MLRRSGNSAADDGSHHLGSSQGQSNYAAFYPTPTTSSSEVYRGPAAPQAAPYAYVAAYHPQNTWSTPSGIGSADLYVEHPFQNPGSSPHLESSDKKQSPRSRPFSSASPVYQNHYQLLNYVDLNDHFITPTTDSHSQTYDQRVDSRSTTTPLSVDYISRVMQSLPQEFPPADSIPPENEDSPATSKKRHRDLSTQDDSTTIDQMERPIKLLRANSFPHIHTPDRFRPVQGDRIGNDIQGPKQDYIDNTPSNPDVLETHQKSLIEQWVNNFVLSRSQANLSNESMNALATLTHARPQLIFQYIRESYPNLDDTDQFSFKQRSSIFSPHTLSPIDSREPYSLAAANSHLSPATLVLVNKYISSCRRTRPRTDGRRSVNSGPYRCLHGCGYRTKRAFDWRRHEETHEPQEIWLCTLCSQQDTQGSDDHDTEGAKKEPFMVSRKDKFLRHVRECHKDWSPEKALELSRLDYKPSEELKCPKCGVRTKTWDERCRHVLGHFEEEVEQSLGRGRSVRDSSKEGKGSVEGSVVSHSESVVSDISDEDRFKESLSGN